MTAAYAADNGRALSQAGLPVTPGTTYLAHFAGPQGAVSLLKADPSAGATDVLGPAAARANPFLARMTVADLRNWAARKMGEGPSEGGAPIGPAPGGTGPPAPANAPAGMPALGMIDPNALAQQAAQSFGASRGLLGAQAPAEEAPPPLAPLNIQPTPLAALMRARLLASIFQRQA